MTGSDGAGSMCVEHGERFCSRTGDSSVLWGTNKQTREHQGEGESIERLTSAAEARGRLKVPYPPCILEGQQHCLLWLA